MFIVTGWLQAAGCRLECRLVAGWWLVSWLVSLGWSLLAGLGWSRLVSWLSGGIRTCDLQILSWWPCPLC